TDLLSLIGCFARTSRNQLELMPNSRVYDLLNIAAGPTDPLPKQWKGTNHAIPSNVNIASIASFDLIKLLTPFTPAGGDGIVAYKSENLEDVKNGFFNHGSFENILGIDNKIAFGT